MKQKYYIGEEVKVEFIGRIVEITQQGDIKAPGFEQPVAYRIQNKYNAIDCFRVPEGCICPLEMPKEE